MPSAFAALGCASIQPGCQPCEGQASEDCGVSAASHTDDTSLSQAGSKILLQEAFAPFQRHVLPHLSVSDLGRLACAHPVLRDLVCSGSSFIWRNAALQHLQLSSAAVPADVAGIMRLLQRCCAAEKALSAGKPISAQREQPQLFLPCRKAPSPGVPSPIKFSPDGRLLALIGADRSEVLCCKPLIVESTWTSFDFDSLTIVSISWWHDSQRLSLWASMKPGYDGYSPGTYGIASTMQPLYLHISSINGTIVQSGTIPALERATHSWAPNGTILAFYRPSTAHEAEQIVIFDTVADAEVSRCYTHNERATFTPTPVMAWSPDCRTLASCFVCLLAFGSTAATYDVQTGAQLPAMFGVEYAKRVTALAWRSDSQACLLHVLHEAQCKLVWWNPGTSTSHTCSFLQPGSHYRVAFSPDGTLFACVVPAYDSEKAGSGMMVQIHSGHTGKHLTTLPLHLPFGSPVPPLAFAPNSRRLAVPLISMGHNALRIIRLTKSGSLLSEFDVLLDQNGTELQTWWSADGTAVLLQVRKEAAGSGSSLELHRFAM